MKKCHLNTVLENKSNYLGKEIGRLGRDVQVQEKHLPKPGKRKSVVD